MSITKWVESLSVQQRVAIDAQKGTSAQLAVQSESSSSAGVLVAVQQSQEMRLLKPIASAPEPEPAENKKTPRDPAHAPAHGVPGANVLVREAATNDSAQASAVTEQVAKGIVAEATVASGKGRTDFHIRLEPPELGQVRIHLTVTEQTIHARLMVHEDGARQLIQSQIESLRQRLSQLGVSVGNCQVGSDGRGSSRHNRSHTTDSPALRRWSGAALRAEPMAAANAASISTALVDLVA